MFSKRPYLFPLITTLVVGGVAVAQSIDNGSRIFPYAGYLEVGGTPVSGLVDMNVALYTQASGGSACDTLAFSDVEVDGGQFQVVLSDVSTSCLSGTPLYLEVAVAEPGETPVVLGTANGTRQMVGSVPFAAGGAPAGEFFAEALLTERLDVESGGASITGGLDVTGNASVSTTAEIGGQLLVDVDDSLAGQPAFRAGQFTVDSQDNNGLVNLVAGAESVGGSYEYLGTRGASRIYLDDGAISFHVGGANGQSAGSTVNFTQALTVRNDADVVVNQDLVVSGNVSVTGNISSTLRGCPSGFSTYTAGSGRSRLCIRQQSNGGGPDWNDASDLCWNNHGAELCSINQMRIAGSQGFSISANYWLRDRPADDVGAVTNGSNPANFDNDIPYTTGQNGGYCCIMLYQ